MVCRTSEMYPIPEKFCASTFTLTHFYRGITIPGPMTTDLRTIGQSECDLILT